MISQSGRLAAELRWTPGRDVVLRILASGRCLVDGGLDGDGTSRRRSSPRAWVSRAAARRAGPRGICILRGGSGDVAQVSRRIERPGAVADLDLPEQGEAFADEPYELNAGVALFRPPRVSIHPQFGRATVVRSRRSARNRESWRGRHARPLSDRSDPGHPREAALQANRSVGETRHLEQLDGAAVQERKLATRGDRPPPHTRVPPGRWRRCPPVRAGATDLSVRGDRGKAPRTPLHGAAISGARARRPPRSRPVPPPAVPPLVPSRAPDAAPRNGGRTLR